MNRPRNAPSEIVEVSVMTDGRNHRSADDPAELKLREQVLNRIKTDRIEHIRLVVVDLHGVPRAKLVTAKRFARVMASGHSWSLPVLAVDLWQSRAPGETALGVDIGFRNGVMKPDLLTFVKLPWLQSTAHVMMDVYTREGDGAPTPRQVLARVLGQATKAGYEPVFGSELEFYLYKPDLGDQGFGAMFGRQSWFSVNALANTPEFIDALGDCFRGMGIPVYEIFNEHGAGQFEINLEPGTGLLAIDNVVALKIAIKEVARTLGLAATFMAKPTNLSDTPTSGYHLHQMLKAANGSNAFHDAESSDSLSAVARQYIAGQIAHARGMAGIAAPSVTAYKRYLVGTTAPVRAAWAIDNRTALVRALPDGENTHIENRLGSSDANPYLLAAVNVAAGLDGIANRSDPGQPAAGNLWEDEGFAHLPMNLVEGLDAYADDAVLVEALGADFSRIYTGVMRNDWKRYSEHVTDWEIAEYRELM